MSDELKSYSAQFLSVSIFCLGLLLFLIYPPVNSSSSLLFVPLQLNIVFF